MCSFFFLHAKDAIRDGHVTGVQTCALPIYVLLQSNMKLSKPYMNKIASHWSRARLTTAKDAINFARNEINRRQTTVKKTTKATKQKEIIPDWFKEQKANQKSNPIDTKLTAEEEQEKAEMLAMLQKHAEE